MIIYLFEGDSDPHLPQMQQLPFAKLSRVGLHTAEVAETKQLRVSGYLEVENYLNPVATMKLRFHNMQNKRVCLFSEHDKYFLQDALLVESTLEDKQVSLVFVVDERTVRNDDFFKPSALDSFAELLDVLDEKINELRSVVEDSEAI